MGQPGGQTTMACRSENEQRGTDTRPCTTPCSGAVLCTLAWGVRGRLQACCGSPGGRTTTPLHPLNLLGVSAQGQFPHSHLVASYTHKDAGPPSAVAFFLSASSSLH